jgi:lipopolysaccharide export LptBFGC system permease protein LptF
MPIRPVRLVVYLWRLALVRLAGVFALLLGVYVLIDAIESASSARLPLAAILTAYPFKLPLVAAHVAPLACTLSVLLAFGALRRRGEWDAAAAAGIPPIRLLAGLVAIPCAIALAALPLVHRLAPASLARFEQRTSSDPERRGAPRSWWAAEGRALIKWRSADGDPRIDIAIERGEDGRAISWRGACPEGRVCGAWRGGVWRTGSLPPSSALGAGKPSRAPSPSSYGFVGASLTSSEIRDLARDLEASGQGAHALRAELALRTAVAAGTAIVPALALILAFAFGTARETRLVGVGLVTAAAYWVALATAWNGAALGVLSPAWVFAGVPIAFAVVTAAVTARVFVRFTAAR